MSASLSFRPRIKDEALHEFSIEVSASSSLPPNALCRERGVKNRFFGRFEVILNQVLESGGFSGLADSL